MEKVTMYTDGSSLGNPGPGGYGVVLIWGDKRMELSGGFRKTTNNRMEMLAAIVGLEYLNPDHSYDVLIHSDSKLLCDAFNQNWIYGWEKRNWRKSTKEPVLNSDLWKRLLPLTRKHKVAFKWVKAHVGIPDNEVCDQLGKDAAASPGLPPDTEYEKPGEASLFDAKDNPSGETNVLHSKNVNIGNEKLAFEMREMYGHLKIKIINPEKKYSPGIDISIEDTGQFGKELEKFIKECKSSKLK